MPEIIENILDKSKDFFVKACLFELLCKFYTNYSPDEHSIKNTNKNYCYNQMSAEEDNFIGSDNQNFKISWFHMKCMWIKNLPKGKWICTDCKKT